MTDNLIAPIDKDEPVDPWGDGAVKPEGAGTNSLPTVASANYTPGTLTAADTEEGEV